MNKIEQELSRLSDYLAPSGIPNKTRINNYAALLLKSASALTIYDLQIWTSVLAHVEHIDKDKYQSMCEYVMQRGLASSNFKEWQILSELISKFDVGTIHKAIPVVDAKRNPWTRWWFLQEQGIQSEVPAYDWNLMVNVALDVHNGVEFFKKVIEIYPEHKASILLGVYQAGFNKIMGNGRPQQVDGLGAYIFEACGEYPDPAEIQTQLKKDVDAIVKNKKEEQLVSLMYSLRDIISDRNSTAEYYKLVSPIVDTIAKATIKQLIAVSQKDKLPNVSKQAIKSIDSFLGGLMKYQKATNADVKNEFKQTLTVCITPDIMRPGSGVLNQAFDMNRDLYWEAFSVIAPSVLKTNNLKYYIAGGDYAKATKLELNPVCAWMEDEFFNVPELNLKSLILFTNEYVTDPGSFKGIAKVICESETKGVKTFNVGAVKKLAMLVQHPESWDWPLWDDPRIKEALVLTYLQESDREYGWPASAIYAPNPNHPVLKFLEYKYGVTDLEDAFIEGCVNGVDEPNIVLTNVVGQIIYDNPDFNIKKFMDLDSLFGDGKGNITTRIQALLQQDIHSKHITAHELPSLDASTTNQM